MNLRGNNNKANTKKIARPVHHKEIVEEEEVMMEEEEMEKKTPRKTIKNTKKPKTKIEVEEEIEDDDLEELEDSDVEEDIEESEIEDLDEDDDETEVEENEAEDSSDVEEDIEEPEDSEEESEIENLDENDDDDETEVEEKSVKVKKKPMKKISNTTVDRKNDEEKVVKVKIVPADLSKGRRLYDERYANSETKNVRSANTTEFLDSIASRLSKCGIEEIEDLIDTKKFDGDKRAIASHILNCVEKAVLDVNYIKGTGAPFLNGYFAIKEVNGKIYKKFGERMTKDVIKFPHDKIVFTNGECRRDTGLIYAYGGVSELSAAGEYNPNNNSITITDGNMFAEEGNTYNEDGTKVKKVQQKKTVKKTVKKK